MHKVQLKANVCTLEGVMLKHECPGNVKENKKEQNLLNQDAMPTKFGFHAFHVNLYLHEFFDPHNLAKFEHEQNL